MGLTRVPAPDELLRAVSSRGGIAVRAVVATGLVGEAIARHGTSPTASAAFGRALMGAALLASGTKHGETVQLQLRGDGPLGSVVAIADADARVRGTVSNPGAHPPPRGGRLDVGAAVGRGVLTVVRSRPGWREPYSGIVPLETGTVAQDIAHYLAQSEQTHSAVALGVFLGREGDVESAGGFVAHVLPDAEEDEIDQVEANVRGFPGPGELVREGHGADGIANRVLAGLGVCELERRRPAFYCPCDRARVHRTVGLLGETDLRSTLARGETLEVRCEFCGERYAVGGAELEALLGRA